MHKPLKDILVVSDMDGTLLTPKKEISQADLDTIRLFCLLGGNFTVATGRTVSSVALYPQLTGLIAPAITCGGCMLYSFSQGKPLKNTVLPHLAAKQVLREVLDTFTDIGIMVMADDMWVYQLASSPQVQTLVQDENLTYCTRPLEDLPQRWNKVLFAAPKERLQQLADYLAPKTYPGVYFVPTNEIYFEMMPKGVTKGNTLTQLCTHLGIEKKNTHVIGDYYNDIDMMKQAGHAIAMRNAPAAVKRTAQEITASNTQSGVGQYIYKLIKNHEEETKL